MNKKAYFYIDDTIWVLRDLTRTKPESLFDAPLFKVLKKAHDEYGLKTQLNLFYRTDSLSRCSTRFAQGCKGKNLCRCEVCHGGFSCKS
ncbi:MAG: hypothetical protein E7473_07900 [Ruminococcaceae bacterium]|nr:hypothetical protein [Oscillospiraceae bacterium]